MCTLAFKCESSSSSLWSIFIDIVVALYSSSSWSLASSTSIRDDNNGSGMEISFSSSLGSWFVPQLLLLNDTQCNKRSNESCIGLTTVYHSVWISSHDGMVVLRVWSDDDDFFLRLARFSIVFLLSFGWSGIGISISSATGTVVLISCAVVADTVALVIVVVVVSMMMGLVDWVVLFDDANRCAMVRADSCFWYCACIICWSILWSVRSCWYIS